MRSSAAVKESPNEEPTGVSRAELRVVSDQVSVRVYETDRGQVEVPVFPAMPIQMQHHYPEMPKYSPAETARFIELDHG